MIRIKIITLMLISSIVLTATIYFVSNFVILKSYESIEQSLVEKNIIRVDEAIQNYNTGVNIKLRDWAQWDDTYQFIQDHNDQYKESNLSTITLINLEINLMLFLNQKKEVVFSRAVDLASGEEADSARTAAILALKTPLVEHRDQGSSQGGIVANGSDLLLVQSLPTVKSSGEGPVNGTIMFARSLDANMITALENLTQLSLEIFVYDAPQMPNDVRAAKQLLSEENPHVIEPLSSEEIAGYLLLKDIDGANTAMVRITMPRDIYQQGKDSVFFFFTIAGSAIILFGSLTILLIEMFLLSRFARLTKEVSKINAGSNLATAHIQEQGTDEIGILASNINVMLSEIFEAQQKETAALRLKNQAGKELEKHLHETENMNKLMVGRELKMIELKEEIQELKRKLEVTTEKPTNN